MGGFWWVWGGHNWVGYIKLIYPFKTHSSNQIQPDPIIMDKPQPTQLPNYQNNQNATKVKMTKVF